MAVAEPSAGVFNRGDLITAAKLDTANSRSITYASGHLNSDWQQHYDFMFYCTRPSGDLIGEIEAVCGWLAGTWIQQYRWEDGTWVEKQNKGDNGGTYNCTVVMSLLSYGEGAYRVHASSSNHAHHRNINWLLNQKVTNERGHFLKSIGPMDLVVYSNRNSSAYQNQTYTSYKGQVITAEMLNKRLVYTE